MQWPGEGTEFHLSHGELIGVLVANGFRVDALHEIVPPAPTAIVDQYLPADWVARWPAEEVWLATKT